MWLSVLGWTATAFFASSYFFKQAALLRKIQAAAAVLWIVYGFQIHSGPVIASNLMVAAAAVYTSLRRRKDEADQTNAGANAA